MTQTASLIDPADILPPHEADDADKLATLTAAMTEHGWKGAPIVVDDLQATQALTGSHRLAAAKAAGIDVPTINVADLLAEHGKSWTDLVNDYADAGCDLPWYEAARRLDELLPANVIDAYGIDIH